MRYFRSHLDWGPPLGRGIMQFSCGVRQPDGSSTRE